MVYVWKATDCMHKILKLIIFCKVKSWLKRLELIYSQKLQAFEIVLCWYNCFSYWVYIVTWMGHSCVEKVLVMGQSSEEKVLVWDFQSHESKKSDLKKPILALPIHRIHIPEKLKKWHQEVENWHEEVELNLKLTIFW